MSTIHDDSYQRPTWDEFLANNPSSDTSFEDQGWSVAYDGAVFYCPDDGNGIEPDGICYCGQQSPLIQMGMI